MNNSKRQYEAPSIAEELIDERDIITASEGDNEVDMGGLIPKNPQSVNIEW